MCSQINHDMFLILPGSAALVRGVHGAADRGAHAGPHDLHLHPAPHRGRVQPPHPDPAHRARVAAPQDEHHCGARVGLQHRPGDPTLPQ